MTPHTIGLRLKALGFGRERGRNGGSRYTVKADAIRRVRDRRRLAEDAEGGHIPRELDPLILDTRNPSDLPRSIKVSTCGGREGGACELGRNFDTVKLDWKAVAALALATVLAEKLDAADAMRLHPGDLVGGPRPSSTGST